MKEVYTTPKWITEYYEDFRLKERTKCFKTCSKCGETKLIFKFSVDKRNLDGRMGVCKACRSLESLEYYYQNQSKISIRDKKYRGNHKKNRSIYNKNYREKHGEHLKESAREWYIKNREAIKKRNLKYYEDNKEACLVRRKLWRIKNREGIREYNREYKRKHKTTEKN